MILSHHKGIRKKKSGKTVIYKTLLSILMLIIIIVNCLTTSAQQKEPMVRISEIEIHPRYLQVYKSILKEEAAASVKLEPGVLGIFPMYQKENPTQVRILEMYASKAAYEQHLKTPHFQKYKTTTLKMVKSLKLVDMTGMDMTTIPLMFKKSPPQKADGAHIIIQEQGSFAAGGTVITAPGTFDPIKHGAFNPANQPSEGQTLHGDHAYVFYQVPANPRKLPLVFWHGFGQSAKTWETTPDGRDGFQNIFLRHRFPVYLIDQPRRGKAARSSMPATITAAPDEQLWFGIFRLGIGTNFYPGVQFSKDPKALDQFFRQMVPNTGPFDLEISTNAVAALFDTIGPGILVTHSHSGGQGWVTAIKNKNIKAIVSYEPGSGFVFPQGEVPDSIPYLGGVLKATGIPMNDFMQLTKIPIIIYYGDYIPDQPSQYPGEEQWRAAVVMAKLWRDAVNKHGGDVTVIRLNEVGLKGNTHFPMSDLNNVEVANQLSAFLKSKGLD